MGAAHTQTMDTQTRQPSGTPVGGQFAAAANAAPDAAVRLQDEEGGPREAAFEAALARAQEVDAELEAQTKAMLAEHVAATHPHIAAFTVDFDEEYECARVSELFDAHGETIDKDADDQDASDDIDNFLSEHSWHMPSLLEQARDSQHPGYDQPRFDVAAEAATPLPEPGAGDAGTALAVTEALAPFVALAREHDSGRGECVCDLCKAVAAAGYSTTADARA